MQKVLCVPKEVLFGKEGEKYFEGFRPLKSFAKSKEELLDSIIKNQCFLLRDKPGCFQPIPAEKDPSFKQIIPYCVVRHGDKVFLFKRLRDSGEERLRGKISIGIGGHIHQADVSGEDLIVAGMMRELHEELDCKGDFSYDLIGVVNDDRDDVGKVHFGLVYLVSLKSPEVKVSDEEAKVLSGALASAEEIDEAWEGLETWSQYVFSGIRRSLRSEAVANRKSEKKTLPTADA